MDLLMVEVILASSSMYGSTSQPFRTYTLPDTLHQESPAPQPHRLTVFQDLAKMSSKYTWAIG
ncbi:hypothetical protein DSO57_1002766 [Entomophthora muscae]|uniref:Uncharacterized protein n=1 Tax=Entomophthora muscae TaxID=34485 RepID=A0ACC2RNG7_9FUNG|nr:hypothetical protein DSO57_1002766 [Entomophthora muscae]